MGTTNSKRVLFTFVSFGSLDNVPFIGNSRAEAGKEYYIRIELNEANKQYEARLISTRKRRSKIHDTIRALTGRKQRNS